MKWETGGATDIDWAPQVWHSTPDEWHDPRRARAVPERAAGAASGGKAGEQAAEWEDDRWPQRRSAAQRVRLGARGERHHQPAAANVRPRAIRRGGERR
ncbi:hypothetical protein ON010_g17287 [Phytophthora cinnamomi]|nr:hypothetical protein ON010_g17287 [Phytophthora cinnamomi]